MTLTARLLETEMVDDKSKVTKPWTEHFREQESGAATTLFVRSTHAAKASIAASGYLDGTLYYESDRGLTYIAIHGAWFYFQGILQTDSASLPTDLTTRDAGLLANVTDFAHLLIWDGAAWGWAPGEIGSDYVLAFQNPPNPGIGWQLCDGSADIQRLNADGSVELVVVPVIANTYYRQ